MPSNDHKQTGPRLAVAMPAYNAEPFIAEAIESVLAQDFADFEFLLLDDGSTDRTREIAERYAPRDKRLRVIVQENRGIAASVNELFAIANAPLIARADADDICEPTRFSAQVAFLDSHPDYALVGCQAALIDDAGTPLRHESTQVPCSHEEIVAALPSYSPFYHPAVMVRRDMVLAVGGYRSAYSDADDYDLWLRLSEVARMANLPEALIRYRVHGGQVSSWNLAEQSRRAAIAALAHSEREAGRVDPTLGLVRLPPDEALESIFGAGSLRYVRSRVFNDIESSPALDQGGGWKPMLAHSTVASNRRALLYVALKQLGAGRPGAAIQMIAAALGLGRRGTPTA